MKINKNQTFNLMDTNGRRNDVINALHGYLSILDNINMTWNFLPNSFAQYEFYKQAIELSPEVFKQHSPYDRLLLEINSKPEFKDAVENGRIEWIQENKNQYLELINRFDKGIEDRARHYTSNLVKLGFANKERKITKVGELLLNKIELEKDKFEQIMPIDSVNLIYLRQLLKLRVFDDSGDRFYSPFNLALYLLLEKDRVSELEFSELVQGLNPYFNFDNMESLINSYKEGDIVKNYNFDIPIKMETLNLLEESDFKEYFYNQKSRTAVDIYWTFYKYLFSFSISNSEKDLEALLTFFEENKSKINKAFGYGKNMFSVRTGTHPSIKDFIKQNKKLFEGNINKNLYIQFNFSKTLDQIREYSDTTKRIFKATGIISFENGYVELAYKELFKSILNKDIIKSKINGTVNAELHYNDYFYSVKSLSEILEYSSEQESKIINLIKKDFDECDIKNISEIVAKNRRVEFEKHINNIYPIQKVKEILNLFSDRNNDSIIKTEVSSDATVSTIFEFIVGIAWYYFSNKKINLLNSLNLTLSANFEPITHAGGGQGDIVIYEDDKVVMLEATLMNSNSQKRGEWEPVLRHSVNLKIEEETSNTGRKVSTFFIADEFDLNTINIWKAVTAVPMQSTINKEKFTDNVVVMPINTNELSQFMDKADKYDEIINKVHLLFEEEKTNNNINWREEFIRKII